MSNKEQYIAVVLAADRAGVDPVAQHAGTACKAFAPIGGRPMILRVLDALAGCARIQSTLLCGPPAALLPECRELSEWIAHGRVGWIENRNSPSLSAAQGIAQIDPNVRILLTTADHALLTPEIVEYFLQASSELSCDATVGVIRHETIQSKFPGNKRTVIRLRDGNFCGCNLFTFNSHGRNLVAFWQQAEAFRKRPWRLVGQILGWQAVWAYLLGNLTLSRALESISNKTNIRIQPVILPFPEAGIDVDKANDLVLVESLLTQPVSSSRALP